MVLTDHVYGGCKIAKCYTSNVDVGMYIPFLFCYLCNWLYPVVTNT